MKNLIAMLGALTVSGYNLIAMAQVASPSPSASPVAKVVETLTKVDAGLPALGAYTVAAAVVLELFMRLFPSAKPLSLLYVIASVFKLVSSIFDKLGKLLDNVLQNTKKPE